MGFDMDSSLPLVSVCMVTYNHEKYIGEAIQSVLAQTFADLELVIVDDGSTDRTAEVIASFKDPRLVAIRQDNRGPSEATNLALASCRGRYVALMSGDDVCYPGRIEQQLDEYARGGTRVLFGDVDFIDDDSQPLAGNHFAASLFDTTPHTRAQILERFFHRGNFINAITCFTETDVLRAAGPFDPLLFLLQDFDMWLRLVKKYELCFMPQKLVRYRIRRDQQNLSAPTPKTQVRGTNETYFILRRFFDDVPAELFREAFQQQLVRPQSAAPMELACEQAILYLGGKTPLCRLIGLEKLYALLGEPESAAVLERNYAYTLHRFADQLQHVDVVGRNGHDTTLYVDTGAGFNELQACRHKASLAQRQFDLTFELTGFRAIKRLRWDPLEMRLCRVRLDEVSYRLRSGEERALDAAEILSNGVKAVDGAMVFETFDPMIVLPIDGPIASVSLRGEWDAVDMAATFAKAHTLLLAKDQRLASAEEELKSRHQQVDTLTRELHRRDMLGQELANELQARDERLNNLAGELRQREEQVQSLLHDLQLEREGVQTLSEDLHGQKYEVQSLANELKLKNQQLRVLAHDLKTRERQIDDLSSDLQSREKNVQDLLHNLQAREQQAQTRSRNLSVLEMEVQRLANELYACNMKFQTLLLSVRSQDTEINAMLGSYHFRFMDKVRSVLRYIKGRRAG
jgi:hypothetical protein